MVRRPLVRLTALSALMILGASTPAAALAQGASPGSGTPDVQALPAATTVSPPVDPISYVAGSVVSANLKTPSVRVPDQVQAGDTLLLTASLADATAAKAPAGWTVRGDQRATTLRSLVWSRTATGSDAGSSVTVSLDAQHKAALAVTAYRGVDAAVPISAKASVDAGTNRHVTPPVTVPDRARVVSFWADKGTATTKWTTPSAVRLRAAAYGAGTGRVSAAVADFDGARSGAVEGVTATTNAVSARGVNWAITLAAKNLPPQADFSQDCVYLVCSFDASTSTDPDGTVVGHGWEFGDGGTTSGAVVSHTFAKEGTYSVLLRVTDDDGDTTQKVVSVSVTEPVSLFGFWAGSDAVGAGEGTRANYDRVSSYLGAPQVYRMFYPGSPGTNFVGSNADYGPPVVVSFKFKPQEVIAGQWDATMTAWFESIPADREVWWSYFHEPENDIEAGSYTFAQYRAAWEHLTALAPKRANLHPTLILMRYSLSLPTKRPIESYVTKGLEVLAWDTYLTGSLTMKHVVEDPAAVSAKFGLDFAIGETAAKDPTRVNQYVKDLIPAAKTARAKFVTWFETDKSGLGVNEADWRMRPHTEAVTAWRQ